MYRPNLSKAKNIYDRKLILLGTDWDTLIILWIETLVIFIPSELLYSFDLTYLTYLIVDTGIVGFKGR